jgi:hypothetical protein
MQQNFEHEPANSTAVSAVGSLPEKNVTAELPAEGDK